VGAQSATDPTLLYRYAGAHQGPRQKRARSGRALGNLSKDTHFRIINNLLINFDDLGPIIKRLDLPMVADREGETLGSTWPANRSQ